MLLICAYILLDIFLNGKKKSRARAEKGGDGSCRDRVLKQRISSSGRFSSPRAALLPESGSRTAVKGIAAFQIEGENLERLGDEYGAGKALVNPLRLRESLNQLRDVLFEFREKGARYDRKSENRSRKARR